MSHRLQPNHILMNNLNYIQRPMRFKLPPNNLIPNQFKIRIRMTYLFRNNNHRVMNKKSLHQNKPPVLHLLTNQALLRLKIVILLTKSPSRNRVPNRLDSLLELKNRNLIAVILRLELLNNQKRKYQKMNMNKKVNQKL
jgi:hypothetical protein